MRWVGSQGKPIVQALRLDLWLVPQSIPTHRARLSVNILNSVARFLGEWQVIYVFIFVSVRLNIFRPTHKSANPRDFEEE